MTVKDYLYILVFVLSGILIYFLISSNNNLKQSTAEANKLIRVYKDSADLLQFNIAKSKNVINDLNDSLSRVKKYYNGFVQKSKINVDSLQNEEIRKGINHFGRYNTRIPKNALASVYGNQAFDNIYFIKKKALENEKININYSGIVVFKDSIISTQAGLNKVIVKETRKNFWNGFKTGGAIGIVLTVVAFLVL